MVWGSAPAAASVVFQVLDGSGGLVRNESVNRGGLVQSIFDIASLAAGVYEVRATVYSQANAGGSVLGAASQSLDLCGTTGDSVEGQVRAEFGRTPTSLAVFPEQSSITVLQSARFFAQARAGSAAAFIAPDADSLSVLGGIGSVSADGVLTPSAPGTGSVRATLAGTALQASASVTVSGSTTPQRKWTILVYLNAANDLHSFSTSDVNEMEAGLGGEDVNVIVQWKQSQAAFPGSTFDGVRRYRVRPNATPGVDSELLQSGLSRPGGGALDMGDPQTLQDFIDWGTANFPSDRTALVIWNHGNGWMRRPENRPDGRAFSYDDEYGSAIQTWELDQALAGHQLDILAWDASLMQMLESAYEARPYAEFIIGSEESPPAEGYPYTPIIQAFSTSPDASTVNLSKAFVDAMTGHAPYASRKITQSVLESSRLPAVAAALDGFADAVIADQAALTAAIQAARSSAQAYSPTSTRTFRDLIGLVQEIEDSAAASAAVRSAGQSLRTAAAGAVRWEGHNANSAGSTGLSIDFSSAASFAPIRSDYIRMKLAQDTSWDELLAQAP